MTIRQSITNQEAHPSLGARFLVGIDHMLPMWLTSDLRLTSVWLTFSVSSLFRGRTDNTPIQTNDESLYQTIWGPKAPGKQRYFYPA